MKFIPLTQGRMAIVDDKDYEWLNQWKWYVYKKRHTYYAVRMTGFRPQKQIFMHRLILNPPDGFESDHINHNGLDNRRANLRACTRSQNQQNKKAKLGVTSQYKGVHYRLGKLKKHWIAQIQINKKSIYLGYFKNEIAAAKAYDSKAVELFGDFAYLNFRI